MGIDEIERFQGLMYGIGEYYCKQISDQLMEIYWEGLKHHGYEDLSKAAQLHMADPDGGQFFPKLGDFNKHITGGNLDKALLAWSRVDRAVRTIGPYRSVVFDDPVIHAVIADMGGWIDIGNCNQATEYPFRQNDFVKRYRGYLDRGGTNLYPGKLVGIADLHNKAIGKEVPRDTVLLGEVAKAIAVLRQGGDSGASNRISSFADYFGGKELTVEKSH